MVTAMEKHDKRDDDDQHLLSDGKSDKVPVGWDSSERRTWVSLLFVGCTVLYASRVAMPVCATAMAKEFGWNKERLGTVMGCFFWGYACTQVLGGYVADKVGGDKVLCSAALVWGTITFITPYIAYVYADGYVTLILLAVFRVILGSSQGFHFPSMSSLLSHKVGPSYRAFSFASASAGGNFGSLLCGGIGSIILEHHGWQSVFYFVGICALMWMVSIWLLSKTQRRTLFVHTEVGEKKPVPWKLIFTKVPVWSLILGQFCNSAAFYVLLMWLPTFFKERFPNEKAWVFNVVPWMFSIPASMFGGWLSDSIVKHGYSVTFSRKFIQAIAMLGCGFFAMLLPHCENYWIALLVIGLSVSCQTFNSSSVSINPQDIAPTYSGPVYGIVNTANAIPGFLGVYMAGFILNASGNWTTVFNAIFVIEVIGYSIFALGATADRVI